MVFKKFMLGLACITLPVASLSVVENLQLAQSSKSTALTEPAYVKDQIIVKFKSSVGEVNKLSYISSLGLSLKKDIKLASNKSDVISVLSIKSGNSVKDMISRLQSMDVVEYAEPDYLIRKAGDVGKLLAPDDSDFSSLWGLNNIGQTGGTVDADIDAVEAWNTTTGNAQAIVAVIDSGVDYTHPDLAANMWQNPGEIPSNGIDDDGNGYVDDIYGIDCAYGDSDPMDVDSHGTHVAGTIGARGNNNLGVSGVNWTTQIMALKFLDDFGGGSASSAIECLNYANMMKSDYGHNIVATNNSWGGGGFSQGIFDAISDSQTLDILFVVAAGNSASDNDTFTVYPASYTHDIVVSVASTDHNDTLSSFSNYGATSVDLGAPGSDILSTVPGGGYASYSGTSMAAPHVTGAAMLALANNPTLTAAGLKSLLMNLGDSTPALSGVTVSGKRLNVGNIVGCVQGSPDIFIEPSNNAMLVVGEQVRISASITDCGQAVVLNDVEAVIEALAEVVPLSDGGVNGDVVAGDGIYSALWTPPQEGSSTLTVSSVSLGLSESVYVSAVEIPVYAVDDSMTYPFKDVTAGELLDISSSDDASESVPLGFTFEFYGESYESVFVGTNGLLTFGSSLGAYTWSNDPIPDASEPNNLVAAFWDDLNPSEQGNIYVLREGIAPERSVTIGWVDVVHYDSSASGISFQVTFTEGSEEILVNYGDTDFGYSAYNNGNSATFGVELIDGSYGTEYSYNSPSVISGMSLRYFFDGDDDGDGVLNLQDVCSDTPQGEYLLEIGCSESQAFAYTQSLCEQWSAVIYDYYICQSDVISDALVTGLITVGEHNILVEMLYSQLLGGLPPLEVGQLDDDEDGVANENDYCPNTNSEDVLSVGCSVDQALQIITQNCFPAGDVGTPEHIVCLNQEIDNAYVNDLITESEAVYMNYVVELRDSFIISE